MSTLDRIIQLKKGETLDEFLVGDLLGEGISKTARIYSAIPDAALKVFTADINPTSDNLRYKKFQNEVFLLDKLKHSKYVLNTKTDFREVGIHEKERKLIPYYGMELMEGDLESLAVDPSLNAQQKIALCIQIIEGLEDCHTAKVCHRDIYTPNILYKKENGEIICKYSDFGSAKLHGASQQSAYFSPMGNLKFTSPEALVGLLGGQNPDLEVMKASDVFAIGFVIFELLTGLKQEQLNTALVNLTGLIHYNGLWEPSTDNTERERYLYQVILPKLEQIRIEPVTASDILNNEEYAKFATSLIGGMLILDYKKRTVDLIRIKEQLVDLLTKVSAR